MPAIVADRLTKRYRSAAKEAGLAGSFRGLFRRNPNFVTALSEASFAIEAGEVVGFLGPNGAGKTTTLKMLAGIMEPTSGTAEVLGHRPFDRRPEYLSRIALVMGNRQQLWWDLPAVESFHVLAELYGLSPAESRKRLNRLVEGLELGDKTSVPVRRLSLGERMKCELVASLLHRPDVLFLDEPTIGLDLVSQERIREFVSEANREDGCTVLLTSHYMRDVQVLCERVIVVGGGKIAYDGSLRDIATEFATERRVKVTFAQSGPVPDLQALGTVVEVDGHSVTLDVPADRAPAVASGLLNRHEVADITIEDTPIEELVKRLFERSIPAANPPSR